MTKTSHEGLFVLFQIWNNFVKLCWGKYYEWVQFFIAKTVIHGFTVWCENCILQPALFVVSFYQYFTSIYSRIWSLQEVTLSRLLVKQGTKGNLIVIVVTVCYLSQIQPKNIFSFSPISVFSVMYCSLIYVLLFCFVSFVGRNFVARCKLSSISL